MSYSTNILRYNQTYIVKHLIKIVIFEPKHDRVDVSTFIIITLIIITLIIIVDFIIIIVFIIIISIIIITIKIITARKKMLYTASLFPIRGKGFEILLKSEEREKIQII